MLCINCTANTNNPKFCSRSCAAKYNNKRTDINRRRPEGLCFDCQTPISTRVERCEDCKNKIKSKRILDKTSNSNLGKNPCIRQDSRRTYILSGRTLACILCGYATYVEICHIKDIRSYPDGTSYLVINNNSNLIALCRNHHWEFDNNLL